MKPTFNTEHLRIPILEEGFENYKKSVPYNQLKLDFRKMNIRPGQTAHQIYDFNCHEFISLRKKFISLRKKMIFRLYRLNEREYKIYLIE
jgi:hypothetical protein